MSSDPKSGAVPGALGQVFADHGAYVYRVLRRLGVAEADVEDVCQEVFIVVHRNRSAFRGTGALKTWIYGICIRTASNYRRGRDRREAHVRRAEGLMGGRVVPSGEDGLLARQLLDVLLDALSESQREALVLYEIEQLTLAEIGEVLGEPLGTVASRVRAARTRLRRHARELGVVTAGAGERAVGPAKALDTAGTVAGAAAAAESIGGSHGGR